jgi:hypothetical protein
MDKLLQRYPGRVDALATPVDPAPRRMSRSMAFQNSAAHQPDGAWHSLSGALNENLPRPLSSCSVVQVDGSGGFLRAAFDDALFTRTLRTCVQTGRQWFQQAALLFAPVGTAGDESLLPAQASEAPGLWPLAEHLAFPEKFDFFHIDLKPVLASCPRGTRRLVPHVILSQLTFSRLPQPLSSAMLRLGCTPVVNLFACAAQRLRVVAGRKTYSLRTRQSKEAVLHYRTAVTRLGQGRLAHVARCTDTSVQPFFSNPGEYHHAQACSLL